LPTENPQKVLNFGRNNEVAILPNMITEAGDGVIRDIFLKRVPVIFETEIYVSAALPGSIIVVAGHS